MKEEIFEPSVQELDEHHVEHTEKPGFFSRLVTNLAEMKIVGILRFYRLASFLLSSLLFLAFPHNFDNRAMFSLIFLIFTVSILMVILYEQFWEKRSLIGALIVIELLGISLLLAYTGGFQGPFLWYALNPFIVSTVFFPFVLSWVSMLLLIITTFIWRAYLVGDIISIRELVLINYYPSLNLIVIMLIMQLFARMHITISEQSVEKKMQQRELLTAYQDLSSNYEIFRGLSNFQRQVVSYKNQKAIYAALLQTLLTLFPFRHNVILVPLPDCNPADAEDDSSFQVINPEGAMDSTVHKNVISEIAERWDEVEERRDKRLLIGRSRRWIVLPLYGEKKEIRALFIGWLKGKVNPLSFIDNLLLFISTAEQTTEWLTMFKQKERVLQHIASIYDAVQAAASNNNPRIVIELFASYARALTGCDKTICWMESIGSNEYDSYEPIYSVKGPKEIFPEDDWQETLLKAWSIVSREKKAAVLQLKTENSSNAQMIGVPIMAGNKCLGILAGINAKALFSTEEITNTLQILADLGAVAVERSRAELFADKLLVVDEQKRIANEIHDTISQNLFSIVYSLDTLLREHSTALNDELSGSLDDLKKLTAGTARDLRALIYRLNPRQETHLSFITEVAEYLDQAARINRVEINYQIDGDSQYLNPAICRTLYRILKESTGNALRHSQCSAIEVALVISPFQSTLKVSDNGNGFDMQNSRDLYKTGNRLGLVNMRELALSLQGSLEIKSSLDEGTEVTCTIPTTPLSVV